MRLLVPYVLLLSVLSLASCSQPLAGASEVSRSPLEDSLEEFRNRTATSTLHVLQTMNKWKEFLVNLNVTAHLESSPTAWVNYFNQAWAVVNQTLSLPGFASHAIIHYTDQLSWQSLQSVLRAQREAQRVGYHYHLLLLRPAQKSAEAAKQDLATLRDLLPDDLYTVMEESDLSHCLRDTFPHSILPTRSLLQQLLYQTDYLLWTWLWKRGFLHVQETASPAWQNLWKKVLRLLGRRGSRELPARFFWLLPAENVSWTGESLPSLLGNLEVSDHPLGSDLVIVSAGANEMDFGPLDRRRRGWLAGFDSWPMKQSSGASEPADHQQEEAQTCAVSSNGLKNSWRSRADARVAGYSSRFVKFVARNLTQAAETQTDQWQELNVSRSLIDQIISYHVNREVSPPFHPFKRPLSFCDASSAARTSGLVVSLNDAENWS
eukprot:gene5737-6321_t